MKNTMKNPLKNMIKFLLALAIASILPSTSFAANMTWTGNSSTDWNTAGNWNTAIPGTADAAFLTGTGGNFTVDYTSPMAAASIQQLKMSNSGSNKTTLNISADFTEYWNLGAPPPWVTTLEIGANSVMNVNSGGNVTFSGSGYGYYSVVGAGAELNVNGGRISLTAAQHMGIVDGAKVTVNSGTFINSGVGGAGGQLILGKTGVNAASTLAILGGTVNLDSGMNVHENFTMSAGTLSLATAASNFGETTTFGSENDTTTVLITGGTIANAKALTMGRDVYGGSRSITMSGGSWTQTDTSYNDWRSLLTVAAIRGATTFTLNGTATFDTYGNTILGAGGGADTAYGTLDMGGSAAFTASNVGNNATLTVRRGELKLGGTATLTLDSLVANGGDATLNKVTFNGGTLNTKATDINNATLFTVGNGTSAAALVLNGGSHSFANGLEISSNATLSGTGTVTATGNVNYMGSSSTFNGSIAGSGNTLTMNNAAAVLTLGGNNTYTGATTVTAGTLLVSGGGLTATAGITVAPTSVLQLGASNVLNNAATMTLSGGTFNTGGFSDTVGALRLINSTGSSLDFGSGTSVLLFSGITSDTGTLALSNWTFGSDSLRFTSNANLLASSFTVNGGAAAILDQGGYYEIVPEPTTWALLAFSLTAMMVLRRRRRQA
jgi:autotransporter-associated beta strand protein